MFELTADHADDGILNQSNTTVTRSNTVDYDQCGSGSFKSQGASVDRTSVTQENTGLVYFISGNAIRTPLGDLPIDEFKTGDPVCTLDNGPQRICWIGRRALDHLTLLDNPNLRPVLIKRCVLGTERDLLVSSQHGMLIGRSGDYRARAKHLAQSVSGVGIAHQLCQQCGVRVCASRVRTHLDHRD